jgi:hypothetical protein
MVEGGGGVHCRRGVPRRLGPGRGQIGRGGSGGVSLPGKMVPCVLVLRRWWVASFGTE